MSLFVRYFGSISKFKQFVQAWEKRVKQRNLLFEKILSFREHQQKNFHHAQQILVVKGVGGRYQSEYNKSGKFITKIFFHIMLNDILKICQRWQTLKFVTASFLSLIKGGNNNLFPRIHLHNTNAFLEDLTGKHFYSLAYKLHFFTY